MSNIYVSDLDGTLLNKDARLSEFTKEGILRIMEAGIHFTFATARSIQSVKPMFQGINLRLPVIELNGAYITDLQTEEHIVVNAIPDRDYAEIAEYLQERKVPYLISSYDGKGDNLYYTDVPNGGIEWYIDDLHEHNDPRLKQLRDINDIQGEQIISFIAIDSRGNLISEYEHLRDYADLEVHLQENMYNPGWYWLTVLSRKASKDQAILELIRHQNLEDPQLTVFGDDTNDIKMMKLADQAVAVDNAKDVVKSEADTIIGPNIEDSVIKYILQAEKIT